MTLYSQFTKHFLFLLPLLATGCSNVCSLCHCKSCFELPYSIGKVGPEVIEKEYSEIVDLSGQLPPCHDLEPSFESAEVLPQPLPAAFFNPYVVAGETEYRLVAGDILQIAILGDPETLEEEAIVAPDGYLYYLFLDGIRAEGRTIREVRQEMEIKLKSYFSNPLVAILPRSISNQNYVILGRVNKPGVYQLSYPVRLRDAIAQAGGFFIETHSEISLRNRGAFYEAYTTMTKHSSKLYSVLLIRDGMHFQIDFEQLLHRGAENENIFLRAGDYIYVSTAELKQIFVLGAVKAPVAMNYRDNLTLMGALTAAGGWTYGQPYSADQKRLLVIRGSLRCPTAVCVDLEMILKGQSRDFYLCPGDIIFVPHKNMGFGRELVRLAIQAFIEGFVTTAAGDIAQNHLFLLPAIP